MRRSLPIILLAFTLVAAGCGETDGPTAPTPTTDQPGLVSNQAMPAFADNGARPAARTLSSCDVEAPGLYPPWYDMQNCHWYNLDTGKIWPGEVEVEVWRFDNDFDLDVSGSTITVCNVETNDRGDRRADCNHQAGWPSGRGLINLISFRNELGGAYVTDPDHDHSRWTHRQITVQCGTEDPNDDGSMMTATVELTVGRRLWSLQADICL